MTAIKNIIFDYGNVIFKIDFKLASQAFKDLGLSNIDELYGHKLQEKFFDQLEKGEINARQFTTELKKHLPEGVSEQQIIDAWNALLIGIPVGNLELLLQIKSKYRSFLLSNNNEIHYDWIIDYLNKVWKIDSMASYFEKDYYSHLMGMRKPDAEIFESVLRSHQLNPSETLFIDDSPQHLETAKKIGLQTRLVQPGESLKEVLEPYL
ncbi:HAD family hydrolase [Solitalea koreensis]|uniref:Putative hydrolase of the HAD superfamily n=1 Tax=Solitalea koreensis TaxID=543615 RepID=A0A521DQ77_9SPHI|nr:HAD family phosphatase [Solitalea koreensis]SMO73752.1 putative hydrolase of the HAD superfamily [Solitalea koreensis]